MAELLDAGLDLGALALCYVAIAILLLVSGVIATINRVVPDPNIPGLGHPLGFIHDAITAAANAVQFALRGVESVAARFQAGLLDALTLLIGIPLLLAVGVYDLFVLLWKHALPALLGTITSPLTGTATKAAAQVAALERVVADNLARTKDYAEAQADAALATAKVYAATNIAAAAKSLEADIRTVASATAAGIVAADLAASGAITRAIHAAIDSANYVTSGEIAGDVVAALKSSDALRRAIADAVPAVAGLTAAQVTRIVGDALNPGGALVGEIEALIPRVSLPGGVTAGEVAADVAAAIRAALSPAGAITAAIEAAIPAAVPGVPSIPVPSLGDLAATVAGLGASVAAIEAIRFIGNETCRGKVSQICDADAGRLAGLLGGLAAVAVALDFGVIVKASTALAQDGEAALRELAQLGEDAVNDAGRAVGQAALAIVG